MPSRFYYNGGVWKYRDHVTGKFLLWFIVGGEEIAFSQAKSDGLVTPVMSNPTKTDFAKPWTEFETTLKFGKVFLGQSGFGVPSRYYSFYFRFKDGGGHPWVTVRPFDHDQDYDDHFFRGQISFLKKSEALELLGKDNDSRKWIQRMPILPLETLRELIDVDRSELRKGVRHIRVGRKSRNNPVDQLID
jgi:hypothetical protein